jgi:hypothetical protein
LKSGQRILRPSILFQKTVSEICGEPFYFKKAIMRFAATHFISKS